MGLNRPDPSRRPVCQVPPATRCESPRDEFRELLFGSLANCRAKSFTIGEMAAGNPALYLTKMTKASRKGKIYIDYLRNERGATSVAPFSPRARPGLPVAVPLDWKELDVKRPPRFLIADFSKWRIRLRRDPWKRLSYVSQSLPAGMVNTISRESQSRVPNAAR
jgi:DNA primase